MASVPVFARVTSSGPDSNTALSNVVVRWELTQRIGNVISGETWFATDPTVAAATIALDIRTQLAAYLSTATGQPFVASDVIDLTLS